MAKKKIDHSDNLSLFGDEPETKHQSSYENRGPSTPSIGVDYQQGWRLLIGKPIRADLDYLRTQRDACQRVLDNSSLLPHYWQWQVDRIGQMIWELENEPV